MTKAASSAHLHAVLEFLSVARCGKVWQSMANAAIVEPQQHLGIRCWDITRSQLCFRDPAQRLSGILLKQLASQGPGLNSHLQHAVERHAFNRLICFTHQPCPACATAGEQSTQGTDGLEVHPGFSSSPPDHTAKRIKGRARTE